MDHQAPGRTEPQESRPTALASPRLSSSLPTMHNVIEDVLLIRELARL